MSPTKFNRLLDRKKYAELGWAATKTQTYNGSDGAFHSKAHMYWTQKGRLGLYDLLKTIVEVKTALEIAEEEYRRATEQADKYRKIRDLISDKFDEYKVRKGSQLPRKAVLSRKTRKP